MKLQNILLSVFIVLATAAVVLWFLQTFELKEMDEQVGFRGEAKTNQLFAARLFLKHMGIPAERKDGLRELPTDTDTVLLIDTQRYTLSQQKIDELLAWVERGGHLITRARTPNGETLYDDGNDETADDDAIPEPVNDALQTALGVTLGKHIIPEDDDLPLDAKLSGMGHALEVDPEFFYALDVKGHAYPQRYQDSAWLLELEHGAGLVTLVANLDFIENPALEDYDHAEFLWHMVHSLRDAPRAVWLVHMDDMPPLWQLLWQHAWALVLTLAAFIPLTILAFSPRFGPLIPTPPAGRRRILEHIHASGLFMWRRKQKHGDAQYDAFAASVEQLYPTTRKQHDNRKPDA
ncbi:MAG: DUF4350 domain-containing protein [Thiothrix sp.]